MYKYIVTLNEWIAGQGYRCSSDIEEGATESIFASSSWNYQDDPITACGDTSYEVVVTFYAADADPMFDEPVHIDSHWIG